MREVARRSAGETVWSTAFELADELARSTFRLAVPGQPAGRSPRTPATSTPCTVCDFHRTARRPMRAWRCAACIEAGLAGELEITRKEASR